MIGQRWFWGVVATAMALIATQPMRAENSEISARRAAERTNFTNDEIIDGFVKLAFRPELRFDRPIERLRKFDAPVRVFVDDHGQADRAATIKAIVADIGAHVAHLDIATVEDRRAANVVVMLVRERALQRTIRARYGKARANEIAHSLNPQCLSGIAKDPLFRIQRAEVLLPVDVDEFRFYDCAYEELLQALGPINDDASVPWTMFNDNVQMGFFDRYDQYLLNILYDPRVRPGMTKEDFGRVASDVLSTVRTWVASANPPQATRTH